MAARWLLASLVVVGWLMSLNGVPSAATLAAFTDAASAHGSVTAGHWTSKALPCPDRPRTALAAATGTSTAVTAEHQGEHRGDPCGPPWPPGPPPNRPPRPAPREAIATATPARR